MVTEGVETGSGPPGAAGVPRRGPAHRSWPRWRGALGAPSVRPETGRRAGGADKPHGACTLVRQALAFQPPTLT